MTAPEIVECALLAKPRRYDRHLPGEVETNLRWAANTLTTNGVMRSCDVTVIAMQDRADGVSVGVASASVAGWTTSQTSSSAPRTQRGLPTRHPTAPISSLVTPTQTSVMHPRNLAGRLRRIRASPRSMVCRS